MCKETLTTQKNAIKRLASEFQCIFENYMTIYWLCFFEGLTSPGHSSLRSIRKGAGQDRNKSLHLSGKQKNITIDLKISSAGCI